MDNIIESGKDIFSFGTSLQIYDNRKIVLSCCKRIIEYNEMYLRTDAGSVIVEIFGDDLSIDDYNSEGITVYGKIKSVSLCSRKESGLK
ncbi:MAG: YabP/YqfC family sporulation protein [Oscillospiraceae bacterium]|nr:YabP/YqfC family sporulation protein [Oscillospiraceae bacterium]